MTQRRTVGKGGKKPRQRRGLRRRERGGCDTAIQKKKSRAKSATCGEKAMAVIQPYKRRRAAPKARPTEKGNLRGDKGGRERGKAYPQPLPKGGEGATQEARFAEKRKGWL